MIKVWLARRRWLRERELEAIQAERDARPCRQHFSYATSLGGLIECGTHGGPLSTCTGQSRF
jgi:hypothetical protein